MGKILNTFLYGRTSVNCVWSTKDRIETKIMIAKKFNVCLSVIKTSERYFSHSGKIVRIIWPWQRIKKNDNQNGQRLIRESFEQKIKRNEMKRTKWKITNNFLICMLLWVSVAQQITSPITTSSSHQENIF